MKLLVGSFEHLNRARKKRTIKSEVVFQPAARENACWALGRLNASAAREFLRVRAERDSNKRVRTVASWAIDEIDEH